MQVSTFLVRFRAVPLRHKIIAAGVAVAIAGGGSKTGNGVQAANMIATVLTAVADFF